MTHEEITFQFLCRWKLPAADKKPLLLAGHPPEGLKLFWELDFIFLGLNPELLCFSLESCMAYFPLPPFSPS
jgi:hypothetical protein